MDTGVGTGAVMGGGVGAIIAIGGGTQKGPLVNIWKGVVLQ